MAPNRITLTALVAGTALLVAGAGSALAAKGSGDRSAKCQERLAKFAEKRGMSAAQLEAQVKARMNARIDAALASGKITAAQATKLKERVASAQACKAPALKAHLAKGGMLRAASQYLGLTPAQLRQQLPGTSLAAIAQKQGKTAAGLKSAMLAPAKAKLAKAVENGRITQARADQALERLEVLVDRLVSFTFPAA
jgi:hypothetical protein